MVSTLAHEMCHVMRIIDIYNHFENRKNGMKELKNYFLTYSGHDAEWVKLCRKVESDFSNFPKLKISCDMEEVPDAKLMCLHCQKTLENVLRIDRAKLNGSCKYCQGTALVFEPIPKLLVPWVDFLDMPEDVKRRMKALGYKVGD